MPFDTLRDGTSLAQVGSIVLDFGENHICCFDLPLPNFGTDQWNSVTNDASKQ